MTATKWVRVATATAMVGALVLAGATAASATGTTPPARAGVAQWKVAVDTRIDLRIKTLEALKIAIGGATDLSSGDRSTLAALDSSDLSGLTALETKTNIEATVAGVRADAKSMIDDYRIYMLVVPKVRFTIASDTETAVIAKLQSAHDKLAAIATQLAGQGKDTATVQAKLADLAAQLTAATSALDGKAAGLLGVAPSPDASAMTAAVAPVRTAVKSARADLKTAAADAKAAAAGLKALAA
jgi:hypothetical protein